MAKYLTRYLEIFCSCEKILSKRHQVNTGVIFDLKKLQKVRGEGSNLYTISCENHKRHHLISSSLKFQTAFVKSLKREFCILKLEIRWHHIEQSRGIHNIVFSLKLCRQKPLYEIHGTLINF